MNEIQELKRQGLSVCAIAAVTGFDRKTVRRYLTNPMKQPRYGPRPKRAGPEEILYERRKTVWLAVDERGEIV